MARKRSSVRSTRTETPPVTEESTGKTKTVKYTGPGGQEVIGIGTLQTGKSYELPAEMADALVAGSVHWE